MAKAAKFVGLTLFFLTVMALIGLVCAVVEITVLLLTGSDFSASVAVAILIAMGAAAVFMND